MISEVIQNNLICIIRFHGVDIPIVFQWGHQWEWKLLIGIGYMMIFDVILASYNIFLGHNINMVHSCIVMLEVQTMLSKIQEKY